MGLKQGLEGIMGKGNNPLLGILGNDPSLSLGLVGRMMGLGKGRGNDQQEETPGTGTMPERPGPDMGFGAGDPYEKSNVRKNGTGSRFLNALLSGLSSRPWTE